MNLPEGFGEPTPMNHRPVLILAESDRFHATGVGSCAVLRPPIEPEIASNASGAAAAATKVHNRL